MSTDLAPAASSTDAAPKRVPGRPFVKGQSGNPKGRKAPAASLAEYVQKQSKSGKDVVDFLVQVLRNDKDALGIGRDVSLMWRMEAAKELLDRGFGKPTQAMEHSGPDRGPIELSDADLERKFLQDLARIAASAGAAGVLSHPDTGTEEGPTVALARVDSA